MVGATDGHEAPGVTNQTTSPSLRPARGTLVVGPARSGTTLMRSLLDGHPEVLVFPRESHAYMWCKDPQPARGLIERKTWKEVPWSEAERQRFFETLDKLVPRPTHPAEALLALAESLAQQDPPAESVKTWIDKTPPQLRVLSPILKRLGPDTRAICMLRDPRAVLSSRIRRWQRMSKQSIHRFARKWARDDELEHILGPLPQVLVVRYEELVTAPRAVMEGVAKHLGISWHETLAHPLRDGETFGGREGFTTVSSTSRDRWIKELSNDQRHELERFVGPRLRAHGYPISDELARPNLSRRLFEQRVQFSLWLLKRSWRQLEQSSLASEMHD